MFHAVNTLTDDQVTALDARSRDELTCPECQRAVHVVSQHPRGNTIIPRHIRHNANITGGDGTECSAGESSIHERRKAIALATARDMFECASWNLDSEYLGDHLPDATVTFEERHDQYGFGLAIEYQQANKGKDRTAVTENYRNEGYTTVWLWSEQFTDTGGTWEQVDLFGGEVYSVWPRAVPEQGEWTGVLMDDIEAKWQRQYEIGENREAVAATLPTEFIDGRDVAYWKGMEWDARFQGVNTDEFVEEVRAMVRADRVTERSSTDAWRVWLYRDSKLRRVFKHAVREGQRDRKDIEAGVFDAIDRVKRIIEYNTGGMQPETVRRSTIMTSCSHAGIRSEVAEKALQSTIENGRVVEDDGRYRLL